MQDSPAVTLGVCLLVGMLVAGLVLTNVTYRMMWKRVVGSQPSGAEFAYYTRGKAAKEVVSRYRRTHPAGHLYKWYVVGVTLFAVPALAGTILFLLQKLG